VTWIDRPPPAEIGYARSEDRSLLTNGVRALDERERRVIYRRYFEDLTQSEIAQELGISQVHVSRLLCNAIEKMRKGIEK
jgi:RNA polymerase sigma-B factor